MKDIQDLIEGLLVYSWPEDRTALTVPFKRMRYHDAIRLYGSDKPDTRFDMQVRKIESKTAYCGVPDPPCLSKMPFILPDALEIVV